MSPKQFIEKAIEGGYLKDAEPKLEEVHANYGYIKLKSMQEATMFHFSDITLDPKAWEAVGRVEGWMHPIKNKIICNNCDYEGYKYVKFEWHYRMREMIEHLIEGGTITSYLETL